MISGRDEVVRGLCLVAFSEEVPDAALEGLGVALRRTTEQVSQALGAGARLAAVARGTNL